MLLKLDELLTAVSKVLFKRKYQELKNKVEGKWKVMKSNFGASPQPSVARIAGANTRSNYLWIFWRNTKTSKFSAFA